MIVFFFGQAGAPAIATGGLPIFGAGTLDGALAGVADSLFAGSPPNTSPAGLAPNVYIPVTRAGSLRGLSVRHNVLGAPGQTAIHYEVWLNGAPTGLFADLPPDVAQIVVPTAPAGIALALGDFIGVYVTYPVAPTSPPANVETCLDIR